MNIERLTQLAEWLEDGAPHIVFNMHHGAETVADIFNHYGYEEDLINAVTIQRDAKGLGDCGTVCCIAGYAATQIAKKTPEELYSWQVTRDVALRALDLPYIEDWYGHPLFNSHLAPENCTPQQAAQAVRNVIAGRKPWA
ncbi:MAG: hypothetical protein LPK02_07105 [Rhodobacterales bacterium]|nr:hypothetical protein [Rhodobacterales bacterium]